ncbi:MAG: pantetheine-phosphate adenylyltransferase [Clostridia bacterium]|nr:pantetheine-phosphate adenylyltransferase [Clostridia bacterium]
MKKAIVTGSFDPITIGHMELVKHASSNYDTVYVVALVNEKKEYMFTMEQKKRLIELSVSKFPNVIADAYVGMTADYMQKHGITQIIRGVRNEKDREYELVLAAKMKEFDESFNTELVLCKDELAHISSTLVRKKIENDERLDGLVPNEIVDEIRILLGKK